MGKRLRWMGRSILTILKSRAVRFGIPLLILSTAAHQRYQEWEAHIPGLAGEIAADIQTDPDPDSALNKFLALPFTEKLNVLRTLNQKGRRHDDLLVHATLGLDCDGALSKRYLEAMTGANGAAQYCANFSAVHPSARPLLSRKLADAVVGTNDFSPVTQVIFFTKMMQPEDISRAGDTIISRMIAGPDYFNPDPEDLLGLIRYSSHKDQKRWAEAVLRSLHPTSWTKPDPIIVRLLNAISYESTHPDSKIWANKVLGYIEETNSYNDFKNVAPFGFRLAQNREAEYKSRLSGVLLERCMSSEDEAYLNFFSAYLEVLLPIMTKADLIRIGNLYFEMRSKKSESRILYLNAGANIQLADVVEKAVFQGWGDGIFVRLQRETDRQKREALLKQLASVVSGVKDLDSAAWADVAVQEFGSIPDEESSWPGFEVYESLAGTSASSATTIGNLVLSSMQSIQDPDHRRNCFRLLAKVLDGNPRIDVYPFIESELSQLNQSTDGEGKEKYRAISNLETISRFLPPLDIDLDVASTLNGSTRVYSLDDNSAALAAVFDSRSSTENCGGSLRPLIDDLNLLSPVQISVIGATIIELLFEAVPAQRRRGLELLGKLSEYALEDDIVFWADAITEIASAQGNAFSDYDATYLKLAQYSSRVSVEKLGARLVERYIVRFEESPPFNHSEYYLSILADLPQSTDALKRSWSREIARALPEENTPEQLDEVIETWLGMLPKASTPEEKQVQAQTCLDLLAHVRVCADSRKRLLNHLSALSGEDFSKYFYRFLSRPPSMIRDSNPDYWKALEWARTEGVSEWGLQIPPAPRNGPLFP